MYAHDCVFEHVTLVGLRGCWVGLEEQQKQGCACTFIRFLLRVSVCVCVWVSVCEIPLYVYIKGMCRCV